MQYGEQGPWGKRVLMTGFIDDLVRLQSNTNATEDFSSTSPTNTELLIA